MTQGIRTKRSRRSAFTLVEILVVAVIIAILLSLVSAAVFRGITTAKETAILTEATQLTAGLKSFTLEHKSGYPPVLIYDATNAAASQTQILTQIRDFMQRTFPRYRMYDPSSESPSGYTVLQSNLLDASPNGEGFAITDFDPGFSLVFWSVGFSGDPANPFRGHRSRMLGYDLDKAYFEFNPERLIGMRYYPPHLNRVFDDSNDNGLWDPGEAYDVEKAYLYFDANNYSGLFESTHSTSPLNFAVSFRYPDGSTTRTFTPYRQLATSPYTAVATPVEIAARDPHHNRDSCQIVSCGLDGRLGNGGRPPVGGPFRGDDADNITNFSGGTMEDFTDK